MKFVIKKSFGFAVYIIDLCICVEGRLEIKPDLYKQRANTAMYVCNKPFLIPKILNPRLGFVVEFELNRIRLYFDREMWR